VLLVCKNALQENRVEIALPVEEAAASRFVNVPFPVGDHIDLPGAILEALLGLSFHDVLIDQALTVIHYSLSK